jgi:hypothetical protein
LVAPGGTHGDGVVTTGLAPGGYGYPAVEGTSFACPHVAAIAALCLSLAPLTVDEVEQVLLGTAQDVGAKGEDLETGKGIVDAYRAALMTLGQLPPLLYPYEEIEVRLLDPRNDAVVASVLTSEAQGLRWTIPDVPAGSYRLEAGTDRDRDGSLSGPGELYGSWTGLVTVSGPRMDLDFALAPR